jgi:hypothetical protein
MTDTMDAADTAVRDTTDRSAEIRDALESPATISPGGAIASVRFDARGDALAPPFAPGLSARTVRNAG